MTTIYKYNTLTKRLLSGAPEELGNSFFKAPWRDATQAEIKVDSLTKVKKVKISTLKANRSKLAENSTVTYNNEVYANSQNARVAITNHISKLSGDATKAYFPATYDKVVNLDKADFQAIRDLIETAETSLRTSEVQLIKDINACTSISAVNAIDISLI